MRLRVASGEVSGIQRHFLGGAPCEHFRESLRAQVRTAIGVPCMQVVTPL